LCIVSPQNQSLGVRNLFGALTTGLAVKTTTAAKLVTVGLINVSD